MSFTPLWSSIVMSSIWMTSKETKILWITMLAMKDRNGFVTGVPSALARTAGLTPEECNKALLELSSPDPESSSPENEGRRIRAVPGGWHVLNHDKYQKQMSDTFRRSRKAVWESVKRENQRAMDRADEKKDAINAQKRPKKDVSGPSRRELNAANGEEDCPL